MINRRDSSHGSSLNELTTRPIATAIVLIFIPGWQSRISWPSCRQTKRPPLRERIQDGQPGMVPDLQGYRGSRRTPGRVWDVRGERLVVHFASDQRWSRPRTYYSCWSCWIFPYVNALSLSVSIYLWIYPSIFQPIYWCIWPYEYQFIYTIISVSICQYRSW